ncbi:MAG: dipeptidyl-peptidase 3 family protein [Bacteroidales bacterium]|jgi:hypothetical protein
MMKKQNLFFILGLVLVFAVSSCGNKKKETTEMENKVNEFAVVELNADLSALTENEKQMIPILVEVAQIMNELFWTQAYGDKEELFAKIEDEWTRKFVEINYGPWERLNDNKSFVEGIGDKPLGAQFYPADLTKEEFDAWEDENKANLYTMIRRDDEGNLKAIWYHEYYQEQLTKASELISKAAELAEDEGFKKYLELTAEALLTSEYYDRDLAWMDMRNSNIDFIVGPIENYEDSRYGYKAAFESFILIKDKDWSAKLDKFSAMLPELQAGLPCDDIYKQEVPGIDSDMGVYQAIYYQGDCNAGSKTIAINLPNDEKVHLLKGSRKLQLKNSMKAKFDHMVIPIGDVVIAEDQRQYIKFDAFFQNTTFHEVGHGMGIKNTINGKGPVRSALKEHYSAIEENKADIMGLYLSKVLHEMGELDEGEIMDNYVTFVAGLFRSIRFGTASAHGKANLARYNFLMEKEAISRSEEGLYSVDYDKMTAAMEELIAIIMKIQGEADIDAAIAHTEKYQVYTDALNEDLERIANANIPRDIVFKQGLDVLGL